MCKKDYEAISRNEAVKITVKKGKIIRLFYSKDSPKTDKIQSVIRRKDEMFNSSVFLVLFFMRTHNYYDFVALLNHIKDTDPEYYKIGVEMLQTSN